METAGHVETPAASSVEKVDFIKATAADQSDGGKGGVRHSDIESGLVSLVKRIHDLEEDNKNDSAYDSEAHVPSLAFMQSVALVERVFSQRPIAIPRVFASLGFVLFQWKKVSMTVSEDMFVLMEGKRVLRDSRLENVADAILRNIELHV